MAALESVGELLAFLGDQVTRRRSHLSDDLLSTLVASEVQGRALRDDEIVMYTMSLLVAGNETTRHLISGSAVALPSIPLRGSGGRRIRRCPSPLSRNVSAG